MLGGNAESIGEALAEQFQPNMDLATAVKLGARVLAPDGDPLAADQLEVALLDRTRPRRAFRRVRDGELDQLLGAT